MMPPSGIAPGVAERILADMGSFAGAFLPPYRELSGRYHVSRPILTAAVQILLDKGVLERHSRKRFRIAGRPLVDKVRARTHDLIYEEVRAGILSGRYRAGSALPKVVYLCTDRHVSNHAVLKAYGRLVAEGLAHKVGRRYCAGRGGRIAAADPREPPVIVVLSTPRATWPAMCTSPRTERFGRAFMVEAEREGILPLQAITARDPRHVGYPSGWEEVSTMIDRLGDRYLGTLVSVIEDSFPDLEVWLGQLVSKKKPVVWFDRNDDGIDSFSSPLFTRCRSTEEGAVRAAIKHLHARGHRRIGYIALDRTGWEAIRLRGIERAARRCDPPIEVVSNFVDVGNPEAARLDAAGLLALQSPQVTRAVRYFEASARQLLKRFGGRVFDGDMAEAGFRAFSAAVHEDRSLRTGTLKENAEIVWAAQALEPVIESLRGAHPVTALLAQNDDFCHSLHLPWLETLSGVFPRPLSLLSFDNAFVHSFSSVSSVDFGFGYLGYQAFHAIVGRVPVERDRRGVITARPVVSDRGSVAVVSPDR